MVALDFFLLAGIMVNDFLFLYILIALWGILIGLCL